MELIDKYLKEIEIELELAKQTKAKVKTTEFGTVVEVKDGVVVIEGLDNISYGELVEFKNKTVGYVVDLSEESVGVIIFGDYLGIAAGDRAKALGVTLSIPVSSSLVGR